MHEDRIDFISAYCDRWCERCAFTSRCSAYATRIAAAMCGDFLEGLELAVGAPPDPEQSARTAEWIKEIEEAQDSLGAEDLAESNRLEDERHDRIEASPLTVLSRSYAHRSHEWFTAQVDEISANADDVLKEAIEIVTFDAALIGAKLHRAQHGLDERLHEGNIEDHPIQNDWNGSAKVALISLERSMAAWRLIADVTGDAGAEAFGEQLEALATEVRRLFPHAMLFVRPGFDEPGR